MAIIMQAQQVTQYFRVATTVADAVRMDPENDYWSNNLEEGALNKAHISNRLTGNEGVRVSDKLTMELCTKHGRLFQVQAGV